MATLVILVSLCKPICLSPFPEVSIPLKLIWILLFHVFSHLLHICYEHIYCAYVYISKNRVFLWILFLNVIYIFSDLTYAFVMWYFYSTLHFWDLSMLTHADPCRSNLSILTTIKYSSHTKYIHPFGYQWLFNLFLIYCHSQQGHWSPSNWPLGP